MNKFDQLQFIGLVLWKVNWTTMCRHKPLLLSMWLFIVRFDNFDHTRRFYWSYTLLLKPPVLMHSWMNSVHVLSLMPWPKPTTIFFILSIYMFVHYRPYAIYHITKHKMQSADCSHFCESKWPHSIRLTSTIHFMFGFMRRWHQLHKVCISLQLWGTV